MEVARRAGQAAFATQAETDAWDSSPGGHVLVREGAVLAWRILTARAHWRHFA